MAANHVEGLPLPPIVGRAAVHRNRVAITDRNGSYRYEDLDAASARIATQLCGTVPGLEEARVAFLVSPGFEHIAVQWGIWRAGGIAVPLPMDHPAPELDYFIRDSEASIVVADAASASVGAPLAKASSARFHTSDELLSSPSHPPSRLTPLRWASPSHSSHRAMIVYTSGTTGRPKGVVTTHANITAQIESLIAAWEWTGSDRTLLVLPLHHVHGIINVVCCALWSGAHLEIHSKFEAEAVWNRLSSGDLTLFTAVPTIYHRLIHAWDEASELLRQERSQGCRSLRLMMSGSAALPRTVLDRWQQITGHVLLERYGMSEVGMALSNPLHGERRPGFVGQPLPGVSVRIVDGELQLKGPGVFSEYWNRPDSTEAAFTEGWFRTGDIAVVDSGAYRLLGRSSVDIIKSGGDKVSALEVEDVLRTHPSIRECAIVGVDDLEWGQRVCCAVELQPGAVLELQDLREWARSRLAAQKIPKDLVCVPQLPRNAMGKVVKPAVTSLFVRPAPPGHPAT